VTQTERKRSKVRSEELKWKRQGEMGCSLCICKEVAVGKKKRKKNARHEVVRQLTAAILNAFPRLA
jgi:hypothetical protein